jgi:hypothetical protein
LGEVLITLFCPSNKLYITINSWFFMLEDTRRGGLEGQLRKAIALATLGIASAFYNSGCVATNPNAPDTSGQPTKLEKVLSKALGTLFDNAPGILLTATANNPDSNLTDGQRVLAATAGQTLLNNNLAEAGRAQITINNNGQNYGPRQANLRLFRAADRNGDGFIMSNEITEETTNFRMSDGLFIYLDGQNTSYIRMYARKIGSDVLETLSPPLQSTGSSVQIGTWVRTDFKSPGGYELLIGDANGNTIARKLLIVEDN